MKKLLLSVLAVLGVMSVNAYEVNDFVYTPAAKFKVLGENVVTNGNFATGPDGWTDQAGADVNALYWQWTEGAGPNGENAMMSLSLEEGNVLARVFELQPATYSVSYWIMGEATTALVNGTGYANYAAFYVNSDASLTTNERQVNDRDYFNAEWRQIVDTVTISAGEYLVAYFDRMAVGTMVTGFEIHEIAQVYDTRIIEKELAFVKPLVENTELFPEQGEFPDVIGALDAALQGDVSFFDFSDPSQIAAIEDFLAQNYEPLKEQFFASNSANMLQHISYGDISSWPKFNNGDGKTGQGDWKFTGDRWGHGNGAVDGNKAIAGNYNLGGGSVYIEKAGLRPGKYLFSLEVNAEKYFKTKTQNDWYFPDYSYQLTGGKIFIGKDSVDTGVFVNHGNFARHSIIAEVAEGDTLRAGFYFPGFGEDGAGRFGFKGAMLRLIGSSDADIALELLVNEIAASQNSLKVMIDSAKTVTAKNAEYPWGMDALIAAIPAFEDYLNSTYSIVDAEGNNLVLTTELTDEQNALPDSINAKMSGMRTAIQDLYALNQPITDIKEAIAYHRVKIVDEKYAAASATARADYEAAIAAAEALSASVTQMDAILAAEEGIKFTAAIEEMSAKEKDFELSCASYDTPADMQIPNGDFVNGGKRSKSGTINNWTIVKGDAYKEHTWPDLSSITGYEAYGVQTWRGASAQPTMKLSQTMTVSNPGVYEFRVLGQGHNDDNKYRGYYTFITDEETGTNIDTTFVNSDLYFFMGATGIPDSTTFHSQYLDGDLYKCSWFSVCYVKETDDAEEFEFGMEGNQHKVSGQGANTYTMGATKLYWCGSVEAYTAAIDADLADHVAQANSLLATAKGQAESNKWLAVKLQRYMNDAATATTLTQKKNTIHRLKETMERFVDVKLSTPGDVNGDGEVLVDDVVLAINCVLGQADSDFIFEAGDMNSDGEILIDDVVLVINKVLGVTE